VTIVDSTREQDQELPRAWRTALTRFDESLATRGMAEKTRRAYGNDVGELARWAADRAAPADVDYRMLRR
jgi:hypothetical protein